MKKKRIPLPSSNHIKRFNAYIRKVVSGKIPACKEHRQACQRHLNDKKAKKFKFDTRAAERACEFIELMPHVKGKWSRERSTLKLQDWQLFIVCSIFGWKLADNTRRFRVVYIKVPRKNGKSTLVAGIAVYMFVADGEAAAEVYSGATTEKQAWEVFGPAREMIKLTPALQSCYGVQVNARNMNVPGSMAKFEPVIGDPGDGSNPSCAITDEYHEHKTSQQYDTMLTGMGSREQPLQLVITTAGDNIAGPCYDLEDASKKCLSGAVVNDELFAILFGIDEDDEWDSVEALKKANPNFGISISEKFLLARLNDAKSRASRRGIYKTKHLNVWVNARAAFFDIEAWQAGSSDKTPEDYAGRKCYIALDLASKVDVAAQVLVFPPDGDHKDWGVFPKFYIPETKIEDEENQHYAAWADDGWIEVTPGNVIDFDIIEEDLEEMIEQFNPVDVAYDPFQATQFATQQIKKGVNMVEYGATVRNFSEPMKNLDALIMKRLIIHNGNPCMAWMMSNVVAKLDRKENVFPNKNKPEQKIDGPVALIMAVGRCMVEAEVVQESVYNTRGITVI